MSAAKPELVEESSILTPAQDKQMQRMDQNGDGMISKKEARAEARFTAKQLDKLSFWKMVALSIAAFLFLSRTLPTCRTLPSAGKPKFPRNVTENGCANQFFVTAMASWCDADSRVTRVPVRILAFLLYGWTLPLLVPVFAVVKSVVGATPVWAVEAWLLSWHTHDLRLFAHLRHAYVRRAVSYRLHAGAAGVALVALLVLVLRAPADPWLLRCTYLAASTLMALCGAKLVPTMYAGRDGRWWTRVQYQLVLAYNLAWLAGPPRVRHFADHLALWLLLCAGVGERFYVLFFTPAWPAYDHQFAVATKCSWVFGVLSATSCMCKYA